MEGVDGIVSRELSFMTMPFFGITISIGRLNKSLRKRPAMALHLQNQSCNSYYGITRVKSFGMAECIVFLGVGAGGYIPESILSEPDKLHL